MLALGRVIPWRIMVFISQSGRWWLRRCLFSPRPSPWVCTGLPFKSKLLLLWPAQPAGLCVRWMYPKRTGGEKQNIKELNHSDWFDPILQEHSEVGGNNSYQLTHKKQSKPMACRPGHLLLSLFLFFILIFGNRKSEGHPWSKAKEKGRMFGKSGQHTSPSK